MPDRDSGCEKNNLSTASVDFSSSVESVNLSPSSARATRSIEISLSEDERPLRRQFFFIALLVVLMLLSTVAIVQYGVSSCHPRRQPAYLKTAQALSPQQERERALSMFPNPLHSPQHARSCGPDAAAAIAKGCYMDLLSFTWLLPECYDPELTADFLEQGDWSYSRDRNGTEIVEKERILSGEVDTGFVTWEYHLTHCLYTWKKLLRHLERGGAMDWYVMEFSHVRHCSELLLQGPDAQRGEWNSEFFTQFPICGYS